jgi:hypothetical protein
MSILSGNEVQYGTITHSTPDSVGVEIPPASENESSTTQEGSSELSRLQTFIIILSVTGIPFSANICTGLLTLGLPAITEDLNIPEYLMLL